MPQNIGDYRASYYKASESYSADANIKAMGKPIKRRRRRNSMPEIDQNIQHIIRIINEQKFIHIEGRYSHTYTGKKNIKKRSSSYIGVSKNGLHWQVLINYGSSKKYIGTYPTEKEAAIAYDFYAIVLSRRLPKTNFSYDSELVFSMINSYTESKSIIN